MRKPLGGSGAAQQYLYCQSGHPHQLTGVYPAGTTCSNPTGATYSASYDSWGNVTSRTYAGVTATLTYDVLDHLTTWNAGTTNQAWSAYDAAGNRVLLRSSTGSGTSITTYAFGLEEHLYNATGSTLGNTYYYTLGGRLIGALTGANTLSTQFFLTDALGSVLATFNALANSAAVLGNQVYGPYGTQRYTTGPMGTAKGYTGQYADPSGLDYYNARYYDPVVGVFISADTVQGNPQGMNPYAYVNGNPETLSDPSGHCFFIYTAIIGAIVGAAISYGSQVVSNLQSGKSLGESLVHVNVGEIGKAALVGAVVGATGFALSGALAAGAGGLGLTGVASTALQVGGRLAIGAAEGAGGQIGNNLLHGQSWNAGVGQVALFGAATAGIAMVGAKLVSKGMRWVARKLLQSVTDAQSAALAGNRGLAARYLSPSQYASRLHPRVARIVYGIAMEKMVAAQVKRSALRFLYRHLGNEMPGQRVPDFVGTGPFSGMNFDVTTDNPYWVQQHLANPTYGQGLILATYHRPF